VWCYICLQITYWDAYDGQAIRIIEGSGSAHINTLATDPAGEALLSGGGDRLVKLWGYDEGVVSRAWMSDAFLGHMYWPLVVLQVLDTEVEPKPAECTCAQSLECCQCCESVAAAPGLFKGGSVNTVETRLAGW
jgi:WD40 repeat protein